MSVDQEQADQLARLIKRAAQGRSWCSTRPLTIAQYLVANGVTLPANESEEVSR